MALTKYEAFVHCAELGSLTQTAELMDCTQSAVSHMIGSLEEELGFSLMRRSRAGVVLTEDGKKMLPSVRALLASYANLGDTVESIRGLEVGTVRIGAFTSVAVHWLPMILGGFQQLHPKINFVLNNGDYYDIEQWLNDGSIDLGFVSVPSSPDNCSVTPLMNDRLLAIVPNGSAAAEQDCCPLSAFRTEPVISLPSSSAHDLRRAMSGSSVKPNIKFVTKDDYAIIAMVEQGLGISVMPELLLSGKTYSFRTMELENKPSRTVGLAVSRASFSSPAVYAFSEYVLKWVTENVPNHLLK